MSFKASINVKQDLGNIAPKIQGLNRVGTGILTTQVVKDGNYFVPVDSHATESSALRHSKFEEGKAIWWTPYAKKIYNGVGFNFSKDKNPRAQALWFEAAKSAYLSDWVRLVDNAIKAGL